MTQSTDAATKNTEIVLDYHARTVAADAAGMTAHLSPDLSYWVYADTEFAGHYDYARFTGILPNFFASQSGPLVLDIKSVTAQDDRVSVYAWGSMPLKAGGFYANVYNYLFRLREGKIIEITEVCAPLPPTA